MLNKYPLLLFFILSSYSSSAEMNVTIHNNPHFYHAHYCEITFNIISSIFKANSSSKFLITILNTSLSDSHFPKTGQAPSIYTNDMREISPYGEVDRCARPPNQHFYCAYIQNRGIYENWTMHQVNSTHSMYQFTLPKLVCPSEPIEIVSGKMHEVVFKIQLIFDEQSGVVMSGQYGHNFQGLGYRVIKNVRVNEEIKNYPIGCKSEMQISFDIQNITERNSWEKIQIIFLTNLLHVTLDTEKSSMALSQGTLSGSFLPQSPLQSTCSFSSFSNSITFTNPNFTQPVINPNLDPYELFSTPAVRYLFSFGISFQQKQTLKFKIKVTSRSHQIMNESGQIEEVEEKQVIYYSKVDSIYALESVDYSLLNSSSKAVCLKQEEALASKFNLANLSKYLNLSASFFALLLICALFSVIICCRRSLFTIQKYLFLTAVLIDPIVKIIIIAILKSSILKSPQEHNKQIAFILITIFIIQFALISFPCFLTYLIYIIDNRLYIDHERRSPCFIIVSLLYNYKFYCIVLFDLAWAAGSKSRRFRNDQLYVKYCWHLLIEIIVILLSIMVIIGVSRNLWVTLLFSIHQGVTCILMSVVLKCVYCLLKLKKIKRKLRPNCADQKQEKLSNREMIQKNQDNGS